MSSLAFSIGSCSPSIRTRNLDRTEKPSIKFSTNQQKHQQQLKRLNHEKKPEEALLIRRREAIGSGLCFGLLLDVLLQPQPSSAAEGSPSPPCELTLAPSGLAFCDKVVGYGPEAVKGQLVKAHYVGKLENGKVFDSSYNRGMPLTFRVGVGEVIKGWDEGIIGGDGVPPMLAGGKRKLKIPPELAYGMRGAGCRGGSCIIPPDSVLLFDVELIGKA
ncbi:hypothetical protein EZV62_027687 [Acer yangbiense]|uniref:peptidylprolyl isomerase n=1 Tax=Acer yangbiense TaxID=1000413 RepID=A0A5C7GUN4_9ROSI|nr:hypothetical protein EZV62_027687 [Acer yangbiense]